MPTLILLRHAKAEPAVRGDDFTRDLTDRGRRDAGEIGDFLRDHRLMPDLALVSSARRTVRTMAAVAARIGGTIDIRHDETLYNATDGGIRAMIGRTEGRVQTLMVVGHNPGIMDVAVALATDGDHYEIERLRGRLPPCGCVVLGFDHGDWQDAIASGGRLDALVFPEDLQV